MIADTECLHFSLRNNCDCPTHESNCTECRAFFSIVPLLFSQRPFLFESTKIKEKRQKKPMQSKSNENYHSAYLLMPNICTGKSDICTFASTVLHSLVLLYSPDSAILRFILVIYIDTMSFLSCHSRGRERKKRERKKEQESFQCLC